ncbi:MAG: branched-chain amino acid ABC transporter ATP-binding protein [Candidatus Infernicultor aquiphilus]|jgi:branched-chain amino acid transport system ATP-binding protein|uniref:Branched-chain amino acid ABC transporter ATP-binding protein n=1 Tax=Candidatus Infernicultor aquiphilus TaxID=1805029 RepID=A0A2M7KB45_9BACT|nr:MAG: branched-chain amino acid ABC transporter ATP-binding protein [Candidatus Atribacteria bacterium CG08_land_8_20_14_0_20_33_29]PIW12401.1 MAG: branched-chain amino acid ABC transporter ATP-binding protein [Candidatus Atribacteria bacterium CG17_big_fil_post_rev_8_21_14_2_50_34_11]PIX35360.1 MAG: branched-chain amino acid ABC transporter ATP-binding protein [Candidatus Atribacteria bacterium CG_4_8_14_3_um_filter_34_18]PIY31602.1 MAG: branched-chain amino acid ABC transporter ATP-binding p
MLKLEGIHVYYQESLAVSDVSISVKEGEFVTIIGANGAGKTTIMKAIMGLIRVKKGKIHFEGDDLTNKPPWVRAEMGIGYIPEGRRVFPDLSVVENLKVGAYTIKNKQILNQNLEKVFFLFPRLKEREKQLARSMSGGEQQMLAIGRAMMLNPKLLLIDEISMGLMPILVNTAFASIKKMHEEGVTILLVEQNAKKALATADRGYVLETGRIVLEDRADILNQKDEIKKAYLGG